VQVPQALLLHVCVPVLQLPQLRVAPSKQATHWPVLGRHWGVLPEQLFWFVQTPSLEHKRGVEPTHSTLSGSQTTQRSWTQIPVLHSESSAQGSPTPQLPQLIPGPEHEFRLSNEPASVHW
jgi:hypothetical protein